MKNESDKREDTPEEGDALSEEALDHVSGGSQGYLVTTVTHSIDTSKAETVQHRESDLAFVKR